MKLSLLALSVMTLSFVSCSESPEQVKEVKETTIIEVKTETPAAVEPEGNNEGKKVDINVDANDGKLDVGVENDKNKVNVNLGDDDKK